MIDREEMLEESAKLENLGRDVGADALDDEGLWTAREVVEPLARMLEVRRLHPVLVGDPGVGKRSAIAALARAASAGNVRWVPATLHGRKFVEVTLPELVAGAVYANQLEHKLRIVVKNCRESQAFVVIEDLATLLGSSGSKSPDSVDIIAMLLPYVRSGAVRIVATSDENGWKELERRRPGFARLLTPVFVDEPRHADVLAVLRSRMGSWVSRYRCALPTELFDFAIGLAHQLFPWKKSPGKACDLLESCFAHLAATRPPPMDLPSVIVRGIASGPPRPPHIIDAASLVSATASVHGVPLWLLQPERPVRTDVLSSLLRRQVLGQDHVVSEVADRLQMIHAQLCAPGRPRAAYLFAGPPGVGKTLMARAVARVLLGDEKRLIRFDMSEFSQEDSVSQFLGEDGASLRRPGLVDAIHSVPYPVILLDEIEKAQPRKIAPIRVSQIRRWTALPQIRAAGFEHASLRTRAADVECADGPVEASPHESDMRAGGGPRRKWCSLAVSEDASSRVRLMRDNEESGANMREEREHA